MFDIFRQNPRKTLFILFVPLLITLVYQVMFVQAALSETDGYLGAVLDDTWIHVRFGYHLSIDEGLVYNVGAEITPGATSPLWVLLLSAVYRLTSPDITTQVHTAIIMSGIGQLLAVAAITGFGWWLTKQAWIGLLAGLITALTGRFVWMGLSGMEITTFTALCILALWSHIADRRDERVLRWRTGILLALATLGRPEGYLLTVLVGFDAVFLAAGLNMGEVVRRLRAGWRGILAYILLAGSYPLVCLLTIGYPLPNTFRAKSQFGEQFPELPFAYLWEPRADHGWLLIILAVLGVVYMLRHAHERQFAYAATLWPIAFVLGVLFLGPDNYVVNNSRYVAPAIPFHALLAAVGIWSLAQWVSQRVASRQVIIMRGVPLGVGAVLLVFAFALGIEQREAFATDVRQLRTMHVEAGEWLIANSQPDSLIALNDVGAIVHISERPVLDMIGLVSNDVIDATNNYDRETCEYDLALARLMLEQPPHLIGVFPWFFPCLTNWPGALQPFNVFSITGRTVIAGGEMVFYWPMWEQWPMQPAIAETATSAAIDFEQGIQLAAYETTITDAGLQVTLWWQAEAQPQGDYTVFLHLINQNGEIVAQRDAIPQNGQFNTRWWRSGDIIRDERLIDLPDGFDPVLLQSGEFSLRIGLYETGGSTRLLRIAAPIDESDFVVLPLALQSNVMMDGLMHNVALVS